MDIYCLRCDNPLTQVVFEETRGYKYEDSYEGICKVPLYCITDNVCNGVVKTYACVRCTLLYITCMCCPTGKFCQLLKHHGIAARENGTDSTRYIRKVQQDEILIDSEDDEMRLLDVPGFGYPGYDVSDLNVKYFDLLDPREWHVSGPDGGAQTVWRCGMCKTKYTLSDK